MLPQNLTMQPLNKSKFCLYYIYNYSRKIDTYLYVAKFKAVNEKLAAFIFVHFNQKIKRIIFKISVDFCIIFR